MTQKIKPIYQCWHEGAFQSDRFVQRMKPLERLFYRTLLQAAFHYETRPYLPTEDGELMVLADAENLEQWNAAKPAVMAMFTETEVEGVKFWTQKRLEADWQQLLDFYAKKSKAGKAAAAKAEARRGQSSHDEQKETETETLNRNLKLESQIESLSVSSDSDGGRHRDRLTNENNSSQTEELAFLFREIMQRESSARHFEGVMQTFYGEDSAEGLKDIKRVLCWLDNRRIEYWMNTLTDSSVFQRMYGQLLEQTDKYAKTTIDRVNEKREAKGLHPISTRKREDAKQAPSLPSSPPKPLADPRSAGKHPERSCLAESDEEANVPKDSEEWNEDDDDDADFGTFEINEEELDD